MLESAVTFAVVLLGLLVAHHVADHWIQTDWQAQHKGLAGWPGRLACARHVTTYTLTTAATVAVLWWLFALPITPLGFVFGQTVSAVTHYWADRRFTLQRLCDRLGKGNFYRLGSPRDYIVQASGWEFDSVLVAAKLDNPSLGTGAYTLDQSWHWAWLFVAALLTALV